MSSPEINAESFAAVWKLDNPSGVTLMLQELGIKGVEAYDVSPERIAERREGEAVAIALRVLDDALEEACVTAPCKEFLVDFARTHLSLGMPAESHMPLGYLGVDTGSGEYGIFDPKATLEYLKGIERRLLKYHATSLGGMSLPGLIQAESDFNRRWQEAYRQKYETRPQA